MQIKSLGDTNNLYYLFSNLVHKDAVLDKIAEFTNVAQFVSFFPAPEFKQRFARIRGHPPNYRFASPEHAVRELFQSSPEASVNIRSFDPERPKEGEFVYGLKSDKEVMAKLHELAAAGFLTIVNETINVEDGGVSGVVYGGIIEFAPDDTPRCVERPGILSIPLDLGIRLLEKVYGFRPSIEYPQDLRVEFSIHPIRRGFHNEHTIVWEIEQLAPIKLSAEITWPNRFSRMIGDKAFGLLVADLLGLPIPLSTVILRRLPPFQFGSPTGTREFWIRTCPTEPKPGRYPTYHGWRDPFKLLAKEDSEGIDLASILSQEGVEPVYSGAAKSIHHGKSDVEGVRGPGDRYMKALASPEKIPSKVKIAVEQVLDQLSFTLGQVEIEWVYDGHKAWIVQLKKRERDQEDDLPLKGCTIFPGYAKSYHHFEVSRGLEALRDLIAKVEGTGDGIIILGNVGVMSHLGDLLRRAKIPSKIVPIGNVLERHSQEQPDSMK
jgi:hypothetical protein